MEGWQLRLVDGSQQLVHLSERSIPQQGVGLGVDQLHAIIRI